MFGWNKPSIENLKALEQQIVADAEAERFDAVESGVRTLLDAQAKQANVALCLLSVIGRVSLPEEKVLEMLTQVHDAHHADAEVLAALGEVLHKARDINVLNAPPPDHPLFAQVVDELTKFVEQTRGGEDEVHLLEGLSTASKMLARQHDELTESAYRRLVELEPDKSYHHYNLGLFYKTRGRFHEGVLANQAAADLLDEPDESCEWNLGICATGAGEADIALEVWKRMEHKIELGRFDLPEGGYAQTKVTLAERPLAERNKDTDDPGLQESIWIERLSPCHGIIRSVLYYQDLGVDYGDVVLIDGAPITYQKYGEKQVPIFPHLATLIRRNYQFFDFVGTQKEAEQLVDVSSDLERDAVIYSHTEQFRILCASCWRDSNTDHEHREQETKHIVTGRIAAPPDIEPAELLRQLDAALSTRPDCQIYSPDLCEAAGETDRAAVEQRRFDMIVNNAES